MYIIRDPRSVAVSYYHHQKKVKNIDQSMTFTEFLKIFLSGECDSYGNWEENVLSWQAIAHDKNRILILKYEDLLENTYKELFNISEFLGWNKDLKDCQRAANKSAFGNMKEDEKKHQKKIKSIRNSDPSLPFVRSGISDEWKSYFSKNDLALLEKTFSEGMKVYNYSESSL